VARKVGHGDAVSRFIEMVDSVHGRPLGPELEQYSTIVGGLGPEKSARALEMFREVKALEQEGVPPGEALQRVVRTQLQLEPGVSSGLKEDSTSVTMGGVQVRKRKRH
jgi:hypothetical protein